MSSTSPTAHAGMILGGRYELISPIASGGMAQVWKGKDTSLVRPVAVKILHPHLAVDQAFVIRFRREAVAAAKLSHPSIVAVYDTLSEQGVEAIVMELIDGRTLRSVLDEASALPPEDVVDIGVQISEALDAAHRAGIVHRDIKPANIMVGTDRRIMVTDFGIAKANKDDDLTHTGTLLGTAKYLAPEQVTGDPVDPRADIYALGIVLFEAATGRAPFVANTDAATALARLREDPPRCRQFRADVPIQLDEVVFRAMARSPDARYDRAQSLGAALAACDLLATAPSPNLRPPNPAGVGVPPMAPDPSLVTPAPPGAGAAPPPSGPPLIATAGPNSGVMPAPVGPPPTFSPTDPNQKDRQAKKQARKQSKKQAKGRAKAKPTDGRPPGARKPKRPFVTRMVAGALIVGASVVAALLVTTGGSAGDPLVLVSAEPFDPGGRDGERNDLASLAIDGDLTTAWRTERYNTPVADVKGGVGLIVTVEGSPEIDEVEIRSASNGWRIEVFVSDDFGSEDDFDRDDLGEPLAVLQGDASAQAPLGVTGSLVLLWITETGKFSTPDFNDPVNIFTLEEVILR